MNFSRQFSSIFLILFALQVSAERSLDHLYQAQVPLANRSDLVQQQAIRQAMEQVLVKISGFSGTPSFAGLQQELDRANQYILEFAIESKALPAADGIGSVNGEVLWVRFNQELIDTLIRRFEIPVWPSSRPEISLGLQVQLAGEEILVDRSNVPAAGVILEQEAYRRGIHLSFLKPQNSLQFISGESSLAGTNRDYMGLVQIRPDKFGGAHVQLNARGRPGEQFPIEAQGANLAEALRSMMDQFIDRVSVSRSFVSGSQTGGRLTLRLRGIGSYENYRQSVASIRALEMVDNLHVVQLSLDEVVLELDIGSGIPLLIDAIELDESLRAENYQPGADQVILRFVTGQDS